LERTMENLEKPIHRRTFLARSLQGLVLGASSLAALQAEARNLQAPSEAEAEGISAAQWNQLRAVQEHLLPSEPATQDQPFRPGAGDVQALGYLKLVLRDPKIDPSEVQQLKEGITALEQLTSQSFKKDFIDLSVEQKEAALRQYENTPQGERWLGMMLDFLLEALLGDPSRGGNPDGVGWKWLGITPGFPLPPNS
jgi:gluconate 2-dehydrogenase gamma chain